MEPVDLEQGLQVEDEALQVDDNASSAEEQGVSSTQSESEEEQDGARPSVVLQPSGYATDVVAIRDVVGNVHTTVFHVSICVLTACDQEGKFKPNRVFCCRSTSLVFRRNTPGVARKSKRF